MDQLAHGHRWVDWAGRGAEGLAATLLGDGRRSFRRILARRGSTRGRLDRGVRGRVRFRCGDDFYNNRLYGTARSTVFTEQTREVALGDGRTSKSARFRLRTVAMNG